MRPLGNGEGFVKERALCYEACRCGRGIPQGQWFYRRADGNKRCVHCQLRARHSTMTEEESAEMLQRIYAVAFGDEAEAAKEESDG